MEEEAGGSRETETRPSTKDTRRNPGRVGKGPDKTSTGSGGKGGEEPGNADQTEERPPPDTALPTSDPTE